MREIGHARISQSSKIRKTSVVYYLIGLNKAQAKEFHDISAEDFKGSGFKGCSALSIESSDNLWEAIANHFYWHAMKIP